jgi:hypothetical protein
MVIVRRVPGAGAPFMQSHRMSEHSREARTAFSDRSQTYFPETIKLSNLIVCFP